MRFLAFADIHGRFDTVLRIVDAERCDGVLLAGDLTARSIGEVEHGVRELFARGKWVLGVAGNIDTRSTDHLLESFEASINGEGRLIDDVGFFGASGGPISTLRTPYELTETQLLEEAERGYAEVRNARKTVFVPHAPPYGTRLDLTRDGRHAGSTAVREFIEARLPDLVVCGHIHEARGVEYIDGSTIVNCGSAAEGSYCVIDLGDELRVEMRTLEEPSAN